MDSKAFSGSLKSLPVPILEENMEQMIPEIGNAEVVKVLLENGAQLHARDSNGASPLIKATIGFGNRVDPQTVIVLLENGADPDAKDNRGLAAKDWAVRNDSNFDWHRPCMIEIPPVSSSTGGRGGHRGPSRPG
ncbi:hypothetical protein EJ08DRAFT_722477 [Tothia fuscella]|uniref:Ankyrin repeat domain-containing protein n=1 Tax=Tothia fuscella TaxID=1048955 RepID=A0A9P4P1X4_9PEZI|nr:hypothetical protein EJ08DRAFT_722477 [Tothia fuscella]